MNAISLNHLWSCLQGLSLTANNQRWVGERLGKKDETTEKELKLMREGQEWFKKDISKTLDEKLHGLADVHKQFIIDQTSVIDKLEGQVKNYKIVAIIAGAISIASVVVAFL